MEEHTVTIAEVLQNELLFLLKEREEDIIISLVRAHRTGEVSDILLRTAFASIVELRVLKDKLQERKAKHEREVAKIVNG
jgi:hypothetical protein